MEYWTNIYQNFNPIAFQVGSISVHWYGIMYATALLVAIYFGQWIIKHDNMDISKDTLDSYIWWVEIGVILGARIGYVLFYDTHTFYYITHPWQIFNPFMDGTFVGISGMSYHGAIIGFAIANYLFAKKYKLKFFFLTDIAVLAVPLGYIFGRIGNFLNQELVGRTTDVAWAINVHGVLRHPSQLYEAILEGLIVFILLFLYRKKTKFTGELTLLYMILYSVARITSEFFRQPDVQLGFIGGTSWLTMGMLISGIYIIFCLFIYILIKKAKS